MRPARVARHAAAAPGSSTPMTGTGANSRVSASRAMADAVLHATTRHFTPRSCSRRRRLQRILRIDAGLLVPYGSRAVSPR